MKTINKQRGMAALTMILVIVVLLAVIGTIVAASRTSANSTSDQTVKLQASSIVDQGNTLRNGVVMMIAKGGTDLDSLTMDTTATTGLFNGTTGGTVKQTPAADAVSNVAAAWLYFRGGASGTGLEVDSVSSAAGGSYGVALTYIKDSVCRQINAQHYGATAASATTIPAAGTNATPTDTAGNLISAAVFKVSVYSAGNTGTKGWNYGCVGTGTANQNIYFNIIQP